MNASKQYKPNTVMIVQINEPGAAFLINNTIVYYFVSKIFFSESSVECDVFNVIYSFS